MNEIHEAILESIYENEGRTFGPLLEETKKKTKTSRRPFGRYLKELQISGHVTKKGRRYHLDTPRIRKTNFSKLNKELEKLRKKVKKISEKSGSPAKKTSLMKKIFDEWYVPLLYEKICQSSLLKPGEIFKINHTLERCEKMMCKIATELEKWQPNITTIIPYSNNLIFIEKVTK